MGRKIFPNPRFKLDKKGQFVTDRTCNYLYNQRRENLETDVYNYADGFVVGYKTHPSLYWGTRKKKYYGNPVTKNRPMRKVKAKPKHVSRSWCKPETEDKIPPDFFIRELPKEEPDEWKGHTEDNGPDVSIKFMKYVEQFVRSTSYEGSNIQGDPDRFGWGRCQMPATGVPYGKALVGYLHWIHRFPDVLYISDSPELSLSEQEFLTGLSPRYKLSQGRLPVIAGYIPLTLQGYPILVFAGLRKALSFLTMSESTEQARTKFSAEFSNYIRYRVLQTRVSFQPIDPSLWSEFEGSNFDIFP